MLDLGGAVNGLKIATRDLRGYNIVLGASQFSNNEDEHDDSRKGKETYSDSILAFYNKMQQNSGSKF
jgi:hypothetical protein